MNINGKEPNSNNPDNAKIMKEFAHCTTPAEFMTLWLNTVTIGVAYGVGVKVRPIAMSKTNPETTKERE